MNNHLLRNLDFQAYRALLSEVFHEDALFALTDDQGTLYHGDAEFPVTAARKLLTGAVAQERELAASWFEAGTQLLSVAPVGRVSPQQDLYLWAAIPTSDEPQRNVKTLSQIAKLLANDLKLNIELDLMATELTERYEELNLVYHTEDQVSYFAEGHDALHELVKNCRAYLDVDLATVIMRDRYIKVAYAGTGVADRQWDPILTKIESSIYDAVSSNGIELIVNESDETEPAQLWPFPEHRVLAAPILDGKSNPTGLIALVNSTERDKFSNSDKNLLRVMARKAGKIIQVGYDMLTGLVNREGFEFCVERQFTAARHSDTQQALLLIDIDKLHVVNDTVSAEAGDRVIKSIAMLLRGSVRESDVVARFGGDEFAVLLEGCPLERARAIADKLRESIVDLHVPWGHRTLTVTVSIGVAPIDGKSESASSCLVSAELACDAAKELGTNRVHCYAPNDTGLIQRHLEMEAVGRIQEALKDNLFELFAQPIAPVIESPSQRTHLEVLLRMRDKDDEVLSPALFMPAAERYHLMPEIDRWVVTNTLAFLNEHAQALMPCIGKVAINLSGQSLNEPGFMLFIQSALDDAVWPTDRLYFEITETAAVQDLDCARKFMNDVKEHGCQFALDDFGSGLSSFTYLRSLPVDCLKIEGSIVKEIDRDPVSASMVMAVKQVADVMNLETVAEYVENDAIKQKLVEIGVTYLQGWAIGKPQPLADYAAAAVDHREAATQ